LGVCRGGLPFDLNNPPDGMRSIEELLTAAGVSFAGWNLTAANGVSGDGTVIAGTGIDPSGVTAAWIATLSRPK
jgi:hypothetical protein